jgi:predicted dithiol-disulfide oxidoreductase (DUF899 family)
MIDHPVVSRAEWREARAALLTREKAFDRERDALTAATRALPWVEVQTNYEFEGASGRESLAQLFDGRSQLIVQHFMFHPDWNAGCPHCSFWADGFDPMIAHLRVRDARFVAISRAPWPKLAAYRRRMGWHLHWVSSAGNDFNRDYGVTVNDAELPGLSVFARRDDRVFHTYSTYARGLDHFNAAYHLLDVVPKGRDEAALPYPQAWVRRHDEYRRRQRRGSTWRQSC